MTIGGENVTLPNLLKSTLKSAIVLFRQMIWGIPKSKGGIVIRKAYRLMLYILFTCTILAACASPTLQVPSPTIKPTNTAIPAWKMPHPSPNVLPGYTTSPDWLPEGIIAFSREEGGIKDAIYLVHTDGTGLVLVADGPGLYNEHPTWSPDGTMIAYHSGSGEPSTYDLWAINVDGSNQVQLTQRPPAGLMPDWSLNGIQIAFCAVPSGSSSYHINLMNSDGSDQTVLTNVENDLYPSWSSNETILFLRQKVGTNHGDVMAMNPDGTGLIQLTNLGHIGGYALSPDGTKMAIHNVEDHRIEVIPIDASGPSVILVDSDFGCVSVAISWSPDEQALALACSAIGMLTGSDLYIVKADGSSITTVPNTGYAFDPVWSPK
jgi:Tol biopolymer transport system component